MDKPKLRGAGQPPRQYSTWEWVRGYLVLVLTSPLWLALWLFATLCPKLPESWLAALKRWHVRTTAYRARDVRIPGDESVSPYMWRWWKIPRNWAFNIYFHTILRSDDDTALHDHPWFNFSIVLEGGYFEHTILAGGVHRKVWYGPGSVRFRPWGSFAHRLELAKDLAMSRQYGVGQASGEILKAEFTELPAKTIFVTGPTLRRWGFHHPERWVDAYEWDAFCEERGISTMKMAGYAA